MARPPPLNGAAPTSFSTTLDRLLGISSSSSSRRVLPRRVAGILFILFVLLVLDAIWLKGAMKAGGGSRMTPEMEKDLEQEMVKLLVRQKDAMEVQLPVEDIAGYADRFIVLSDLHSLRQSLPHRYPGLNSTRLATYERSLDFHHDKLFARLFPYVFKSPSRPRGVQEIVERYTEPEGILIPCGKDQFQMAVHLVATLKYVHKTTMPIQIVYAGNDDLPPDRRAALKSIHPSVETFDVLNYFDEEWVGLLGGGWAIKVFAILATQYERVIICDADAVFFQDPLVLFQDPGYIKTGTLFFRDREIFPGDGNVHDWWAGVMKGRTPSEQMMKSRWYTDRASREEMESGVVVFDKGRREVLMGLVYTGYLNTRRVREPVTYANTYGDKESFWMAFELAKIPYHLDPEYASIIGQLTHPDGRAHSIESRICSEHLFHLDHKGRPLWFNGSLFAEKRVKDHGWFLAMHWARGTVDWRCDTEPWCMAGIQERDVQKLTDHEHQILTHMIGTALVWESRFPTLVDKHY